jgi:hypothetical protein
MAARGFKKSGDFWLTRRNPEIAFDCAQGRLSLRRKSGRVRDDGRH